MVKCPLFGPPRTAGALAGPAMLLAGTEQSHTSLALYVLIRGLTLLIRCGNLPQAHPLKVGGTLWLLARRWNRLLQVAPWQWAGYSRLSLGLLEPCPSRSADSSASNYDSQQRALSINLSCCLPIPAARSADAHTVAARRRRAHVPLDRPDWVQLDRAPTGGWPCPGPGCMTPTTCPLGLCVEGHGH